MSMVHLLPGGLHARARRVLPAALRTVSAQLLAPASLTALLLPLRRPSTGALLFVLRKETCQRLCRDPASVLDQAMMLGRADAQGLYRPWRRVLAPASLGMVHFTARGDDRAWLVVVPAQAVALYLWRD